jgi:hypothetical protein
MIDRRALTILLLVATTAIIDIPNANAFAVLPSSSSSSRSILRASSAFQQSSEHSIPDVGYQQQQVVNDDAPHNDTKKLIMDIPPMPSSSVVDTTTTTAVAPKKPKKAGGGNPHKEGVFSPIVVAAGVILGEEQLNKIRGQAIALHSDLIKSFVDTSDSTLGQAVLRQLFTLVDTDNSGYLDKTEVAQALNLLGFKWLGDSQVDKIFERADADGDKTISLDEFMKEAPKTLRTNLVKLAKSNGGEMGLLV